MKTRGTKTGRKQGKRNKDTRLWTEMQRWRQKTKGGRLIFRLSKLLAFVRTHQVGLGVGVGLILAWARYLDRLLGPDRETNLFLTFIASICVAARYALIAGQSKIHVITIRLLCTPFVYISVPTRGKTDIISTLTLFKITWGTAIIIASNIAMPTLQSC